MYLDEIENTEDVIDSRSINKRIDYLNDQLKDYVEADSFETKEDYITEEEEKELKNLKELREEAEDYCPDWNFGAQLIRDSYFLRYTENLIRECENLDELPNYLYVDWERTARDVKMDYTTVNFDGIDYNVR